MPKKYVVKQYEPDSCYHVFNRGSAFEDVFIEQVDCDVFLKFVDKYAQFYEIDIFIIALAKNHFHFLIKQNKDRAIEKFMHGVGICYAMWFNKKYFRIGPLFESNYKARLLLSERDLFIVYRYIYKHTEKDRFIAVVDLI